MTVVGPGSLVKVKAEIDTVQKTNRYEHPIYGELSYDERVLTYCKLEKLTGTAIKGVCQYLVVDNCDSDLYKESVVILQQSAIIGVSFYESVRDEAQYRFLVISCSSFILLVNMLNVDNDQISERYHDLVALLTDHAHLKVVYGCPNLFFFVQTYFQVHMDNFMDLEMLHYGLHNIRSTEPLRDTSPYTDMVKMLFNVTFKIQGQGFFTNEDALNKLAFNAYFLIPIYEFMLNRLLEPAKSISRRICHLNIEGRENDSILTDISMAPGAFHNLAILPRSLQFWTYKDTSTVLQAKKVIDKELNDEKEECNDDLQDVVKIHKKYIYRHEEKKQKCFDKQFQSIDSEIDTFVESNSLWRKDISFTEIMEIEKNERLGKPFPIIRTGKGRGLLRYSNNIRENSEKNFTTTECMGNGNESKYVTETGSEDKVRCYPIRLRTKSYGSFNNHSNDKSVLTTAMISGEFYGTKYFFDKIDKQCDSIDKMNKEISRHRGNRCSEGLMEANNANDGKESCYSPMTKISIAGGGIKSRGEHTKESTSIVGDGIIGRNGNRIVSTDNHDYALGDFIKKDKIVGERRYPIRLGQRYIERIRDRNTIKEESCSVTRTKSTQDSNRINKKGDNAIIPFECDKGKCVRMAENYDKDVYNAEFGEQNSVGETIPNEIVVSHSAHNTIMVSHNAECIDDSIEDILEAVRLNDVRVDSVRRYPIRLGAWSTSQTRNRDIDLEESHDAMGMKLVEEDSCIDESNERSEDPNNAADSVRVESREGIHEVLHGVLKEDKLAGVDDSTVDNPEGVRVNDRQVHGGRCYPIRLRARHASSANDRNADLNESMNAIRINEIEYDNCVNENGGDVIMQCEVQEVRCLAVEVDENYDVQEADNGLVGQDYEGDSVLNRSRDWNQIAIDYSRLQVNEVSDNVYIDNVNAIIPCEVLMENIECRCDGVEYDDNQVDANNNMENGCYSAKVRQRKCNEGLHRVGLGGKSHVDKEDQLQEVWDKCYNDGSEVKSDERDGKKSCNRHVHMDVYPGGIVNGRQSSLRNCLRNSNRLSAIHVNADYDNRMDQQHGLGRGVSPLMNVRPSINGYEDAPVRVGSECSNTVSSTSCTVGSNTSNIENMGVPVIVDCDSYEERDYCELPQSIWTRNRVGKLSLDKFNQPRGRLVVKNEAQGIMWNAASIKGDRITEELYREFGLK